jgi:putative hydrolase of the HAD superfamily
VVHAVFFDVDFTLIYPGPTLRGQGYQFFCARHGVAVDPMLFQTAVERSASILDHAADQTYDAQVFIDSTRSIIEHMGGQGPGAAEAASEIYREWAACHHFFLYDDVESCLKQLAGAGIKIGLISNTHRSLAAFASHFELEGLISASVSSSEHGYLKPHPSIFEAAMKALGVTAAESVMVGDSVKHDIEGARQVGMAAILVRRTDGVGSPLQPGLDAGFDEVRIIGSLAELPGLLLKDLPGPALGNLLGPVR